MHRVRHVGISVQCKQQPLSTLQAHAHTAEASANRLGRNTGIRQRFLDLVHGWRCHLFPLVLRTGVQSWIMFTCKHNMAWKGSESNATQQKLEHGGNGWAHGQTVLSAANAPAFLLISAS